MTCPVIERSDNWGPDNRGSTALGNLCPGLSVFTELEIEPEFLTEYIRRVSLAMQ